jgi:nucleoside-diphosphate-sugar epimerase
VNAKAGTVPPQTPRSVFITGARGFIGATLAERYRSQGVEVRGVDVAGDPERGVVAADVSEPGDWQRHAEGCEVVFHTAALITFAPALDRFWRVNTLGTRRALDAAIAAGARRFVHFSSITVFGFDYPDGVEETHPVRLTGVPYIDTKIASEQVVLQAQAAGELPCTIVRPGDVYGPGSQPWTRLPVEELRRGRLMLPAGGRGEISPVYVDNLVDGVTLAAAEPAAAGQVITITDGRAVQTQEFFGYYARLLGKRRAPTAPTPVVKALAGTIALAGRVRGVEVEVNPRAVAYVARRGTYSIAKARRLLGYEPRVSLEEGMARTERWLREEGLV